MATLDIVTIAEATAYLAGSATSSSPLLDQWITAASAAVDDLCGPVVARTTTGHSWYTIGESRLLFPMAHVTACASMVEYDATGAAKTLTAETATTKPADAYRLWPANGCEWVERRGSGGRARFPVEGTVVATFTAGRFANTAAVSQLWKRATLVIVSHMWSVEHGTGNTFGEVQLTPTGFAIPRRAVELLGSEVRTSVAVA